MVASMVNIQHQVVTHKLHTKHSKGVTMNCFLPLERLTTLLQFRTFYFVPGKSRWLARQWSQSSCNNSNPYCNAHTALSTQDFTVNYGAVLRNQAAHVLLSLSDKYNYSRYGFCDRMLAMTFSSPQQYTIFMGSSVNCSNQ